MAESPPWLKEAEDCAVRLVREAGGLLMERFQRPMAIEYKDKEGWRDPVTEADRTAETFLSNELAARFPEHGFVGEEGEGRAAGEGGLTWVVDPLDGTTNFANGLPSFCCSIGLLEHGEPVVGAIFLPWPDTPGGRVFHARRGGGAWEGEDRLQVAPGEKPVAGRVTVRGGFIPGRFRPSKELLKNAGQQRSVGSTAYELALTADGTYQFTLHGAPHSWDVAAGIVLVQEAGGTVLSRGRQGWGPLTSFLSDTANGDATKQLRDWRQTVLCGNADMVRFVQEGLLPLPLSTRVVRGAKQALRSRKRSGTTQ